MRSNLQRCTVQRENGTLLVYQYLDGNDGSESILPTQLFDQIVQIVQGNITFSVLDMNLVSGSPPVVSESTTELIRSQLFERICLML